MINRSLLIIGIVLAVVGFAAAFLLNQIFAKPTDFIMAANMDIPAGTYLSELPSDAFVQVPVQFSNTEARALLNGVTQPQQLSAMVAANGVLIKDIYKYEPLTLSSVVSADNPAAARIARLGLDNPDFMVISIPASGNVPAGLIAGDRVDLAVTISSVADPLNLEEDETGPTYSLAQSGAGAMTPEMLATLLEEEGYEITAPEEATSSTSAEGEEAVEEAPSGPTLREPVTKLLVRGALVLNVQYDTSIAGVSSEGETQIMRGDLTGIDVVIPRDAFEFVTMAINSGNLQVGLLSPLVEESVDEPTLGATLQDFLDLFVSDREELSSEMESSSP
jgi:hypothetical protein